MMVCLRWLPANQKGFVLIAMMFMMLLLAVTAVSMNRRAGLQQKIAANQARSVQIKLGQVAAIEKAVWQLKQTPGWRTDPSGEDFVYNGITYNRKVLNSEIAGYTDAITVSITTPGGTKTLARSFQTSSIQSEVLLIGDTSNHRVREVDLTTGIITTIAGTGSSGYNGDDGPATSAAVGQPKGLGMDSSGNIYIVGYDCSCIRKVDAETKVITTVAGTGVSGYSGDYFPATSARLDGPLDVFVDGSGDIYIADTNNHCIRKVDGGIQIITTVAGTGSAGYSGDDGPATSAQLNMPAGVWVDESGNIYIADRSNHRIRKVDGETQIITTIAGTGSGGYSGDDGPATGAQLYHPRAVSLDADGNIYIAELLNCVVRKINAETQIITTVAGIGESCDYNGDDGPATSAQLEYPTGVSVDASGNLYIADWNNQRIRKVDGETQIITTIAGTGSAGYGGDDGPAINALLSNMQGVYAGAVVSSSSFKKVSDLYWRLN